MKNRPVGRRRRGSFRNTGPGEQLTSVFDPGRRERATQAKAWIAPTLPHLRSRDVQHLAAAVEPGAFVDPRLGLAASHQEDVLDPATLRL